MPITDLKWGLEVLKDNQHFFLHLEKYIASMRDVTTPIESGQIWYALPEGSYVWLVGKRHDRDRKQDADWQCFAVIVEGTLRPIPDRLPGPSAWEIHFITQGTRRIDPLRKRPGLLLCAPHTQTSRSMPTQRFGRALWIPVQSKTPNRYGCLHIRGASDDDPDRPGCFRFWSAWSVDIADKFADNGDVRCRGDLLNPTGHLSRCTSSVEQTNGLLGVTTRLVAETLGIRSLSTTRSRHARQVGRPVPQRGEVVLVRFGSGQERTPCVVVSPDALNRAYDDLVVIQCLSFEIGDEVENATVVPLSKSFLFRGRRWSLSLVHVRGIAFAHRYYELCSPRVVLESVEIREVDARLRNLYA